MSTSVRSEQTWRRAESGWWRASEGGRAAIGRNARSRSPLASPNHDCFRKKISCQDAMFARSFLASPADAERPSAREEPVRHVFLRLIEQYHCAESCLTPQLEQVVVYQLIHFIAPSVGDCIALVLHDEVRYITPFRRPMNQIVHEQ